MKKKTALVASMVTAVTLAVLLAGCTPPANSTSGAGVVGAAATGTVKATDLPKSCKSDKPVIGVALPDTTNPYYVAMRQGFLDAAAKDGFHAVVAVANDDDATQLTQVQSFIQQKVCAVALNPVDSGPGAASVKALNNAGIPAFTVNLLVSGSDLKSQGAHITQFVGADQVQGGRAQGEQAVKDFAGTPIVTGIVGFPDSVTANQRDAAFTKALGSKGTIKAKVDGKADPNVSLQVTTDMLQGNPDINVVFGDTGPAVLGAIQAVNQLGLAKKVSVYGFCAANTALEGAYKSCVAQEPAVYAGTVVKSIRSYVDGHSIEATILVPVISFVTGGKPDATQLG
jgi:ribose transport system substrate-binding protein